jgi:hypothetical protein
MANYPLVVTSRSMLEWRDKIIQAAAGDHLPVVYARGV